MNKYIFYKIAALPVKIVAKKKKSNKQKNNKKLFVGKIQKKSDKHEIEMKTTRNRRIRMELESRNVFRR